MSVIKNTVLSAAFVVIGAIGMTWSSPAHAEKLTDQCTPGTLCTGGSCYAVEVCNGTVYVGPKIS